MERFLLGSSSPLALLLFSFVLTACDQKQAVEYNPKYASVPLEVGEQVFIIGVHPMHNPKRLHKIFSPIAEYLSENIEGASFKIEGATNFDEYEKKLQNRKFHFALPNPFQTVNAFKDGYNVFAKMANDKNFRGVILVRKDSGIKKLSDLKGQSMAFPAPAAVAATMLPQAYLQQHGVDISKDLDIKYVGSQESSIMNVMLGNTKASGVFWPSWRVFSKRRPELAQELKIIWQSSSLPHNSFMTRNDIDAEIVNQVKILLLKMNKQKGIHKMLRQYEAANNETYDPMVEFLKSFNKDVRPIY